MAEAATWIPLRGRDFGNDNSIKTSSHLEGIVCVCVADHLSDISRCRLEPPSLRLPCQRGRIRESGEGIRKNDKLIQKEDQEPEKILLALKYLFHKNKLLKWIF